MHERIYRAILEYASNGKAPILSPIEKEVYDHCRHEMIENPGVVLTVPTSYPESGIEMRYAGANGDGLTLEEVTKLSEIAEAVFCKTFSEEIAEHFWRLLQLHFGGSCSGSIADVASERGTCGRCPASSLSQQSKFPSRKHFSVSSPHRPCEGIPALSR